MTKRLLLLAVLLLALPGGAAAQFTYRWIPVPMDSTWDTMKDLRATQTIARYEAQVAPLQEIVGYSDAEYDKGRPEGPLSNFAADVVRAIAEKKTGEHMDVSLMNMGGIRTSLPQGAVRVYDIYSIFPFDNYLVTFDIKGSDLRRFLNQMISRRRVEALSGVKMVITANKADTLLVSGAPIDDNRIYKFATINFLMDGGDGVVLSDVAINLKDTGIWVRDAIVEYLKDQTARGEKISLKTDGRVVYTDWEERRR